MPDQAQVVRSPSQQIVLSSRPCWSCVALVLNSSKTGRPEPCQPFHFTCIPPVSDWISHCSRLEAAQGEKIENTRVRDILGLLVRANTSANEKERLSDEEVLARKLPSPLTETV